LDAAASFRGFTSVAFSPDGRILAAGSGSGRIRLWNVTHPARPAAIDRPLTMPYSVCSLAFSPDGRTLAAGSNNAFDGTSIVVFDSPGYIRLWDVSDPARATRPSPLIAAAGKAGFTSVAFSPRGHFLASGSDGSGTAGSHGNVQLWDVSDPARPTALGQSLT
jgi:WD40 repeat protein